MQALNIYLTSRRPKKTALGAQRQQQPDEVESDATIVATLLLAVVLGL
jgi:hypothetical protein